MKWLSKNPLHTNSEWAEWRDRRTKKKKIRFWKLFTARRLLKLAMIKRIIAPLTKSNNAQCPYIKQWSGRMKWNGKKIHLWPFYLWTHEYVCMWHLFLPSFFAPTIKASVKMTEAKTVAASSLTSFFLAQNRKNIVIEHLVWAIGV